MKTNKVKSVVFVSNYFNHHQRPISDELNKIFGDGYKFIETAPMEEERVKLGWGVKEFPSYVVTSERFSDNTSECIELVDSADVVIIGSAPEWIIENRKKNNRYRVKGFLLFCFIGVFIALLFLVAFFCEFISAYVQPEFNDRERYQ